MSSAEGITAGRCVFDSAPCACRLGAACARFNPDGTPTASVAEVERQRVLALPGWLRQELLYLAAMDPKSSTRNHNIAVAGERIMARLGREEEDTRDPVCVERWPMCTEGAYDPRCCRFPKSCSCILAKGEHR